MNLEQIAQQAMDCLDSVGVAADYEIKSAGLVVITDKHKFTHNYDDSYHNLINDIIYIYPTKSPN